MSCLASFVKCPQPRTLRTCLGLGLQALISVLWSHPRKAWEVKTWVPPKWPCVSLPKPSPSIGTCVQDGDPSWPPAQTCRIGPFNRHCGRPAEALSAQPPGALSYPAGEVCHGKGQQAQLPLQSASHTESRKLPCDLHQDACAVTGRETCARTGAVPTPTLTPPPAPMADSPRHPTVGSGADSGAWALYRPLELGPPPKKHSKTQD